MLTKATLLKKLTLPVVQAPMFLVSNVDLVVASAKAGIIGTMPSQNARSSVILDDNIKQIKDRLKGIDNPIWGINVITHSSFVRAERDIEVIVSHQVPIVISALGSPKKLVDAVHGYGGLVFADVINMRFAKKAIASGVDGLVLISNGAGGHTGYLNPFAFITEIKKIFDGIIVLGGGITNGEQVLAAQVMGADLVYIGTRFIATQESSASNDYKRMILASDIMDIVLSDKITGVSANWLKPALDKAQVPPHKKALLKLIKLAVNYLPKKFTRLNLSKMDSDKVSKQWKDIYSAGQGVGDIDQELSVAELVSIMASQYEQSLIKIRE